QGLRRGEVFVDHGENGLRLLVWRGFLLPAPLGNWLDGGSVRDRTSWPVVGVPINAPIESLPIGGWRSLAARTVRDREAPGSNPGPPTKICTQNPRFRRWFATAGSQIPGEPREGHRVAVTCRRTHKGLTHDRARPLLPSPHVHGG